MNFSSQITIKYFLLLILFTFVSFSAQAQVGVNRIYTDWNNFFTSDVKTTDKTKMPDNENNLLAFTWNGITYSTGVNDAILTTKGVVFKTEKFRALKIQSIKSGPGSYYLQGSLVDGSYSERKLIPRVVGSQSTPAELASRLTDGLNGLSLGTGIANIATSEVSFKVGTNNININVLGDDVPDILVTQVADPGGTPDTFKFVDSDGTIVGDAVTVNFKNISAVGTYRLDLFNSSDGLISNFSADQTRDIRILGIKMEDFKLTAANAAQVDRFVVKFSGSSDCAFIAFNSNSLKEASVALMVKPKNMNSCYKADDTIEYSYEVTNTGDVSLTNIQVQPPFLGTVNSDVIAKLDPNETVTVTGEYTITAADIAAGQIINSAKVTAIDPSDNIVEDVSGQTTNDDISTTTVLFQPPTVTSIKHATCVEKGSITLSNLPSSGNWTLKQTGKSAKNYSGTTATFTVLDLEQGDYEFAVESTDGCKSPKSLPVKVIGAVQNSWNGSEWSTKNLPTIDEEIVFNGDATIATDIIGCNCVVNTGVKVVFNSGSMLKLRDKLTNKGTLTFENNASLVQENDVKNEGNIVYQRTSKPMKNFDYTYWSSPVLNQKAKNLSPNTFKDKYFKFGSDVNNWIFDNGTMTPGIGYIIRVPKPGGGYANGKDNWSGEFYDQPVEFIGVPNNGTIIGETVKNNQKYLIGNPYPSALDADSFISGNNFLNGALYFWTHNTAIKATGTGQFKYTADDYAIYNGVGGVSSRSAKSDTSHGSDLVLTDDNGLKPTGNIAAGQSFFAITNAEGTVTFTNNMRKGKSNSEFFKTNQSKNSTNKSRVWLNLTNAEGAFKQILVGYVAGATNAQESQFDAETFNGNAFINFYTVLNELEFSIQGRALPFSDTDEIPLGYSSKIVGEFTIAIDEVDGDLANQDIFIEDKLRNTTFNLRKDGYNFTTAEGTFNDRFILKYTAKTLGLDDFEKQTQTVQVSVRNKVITIDAASDTIEKVVIYDISGKTIYSKNKINASVFELATVRSSDQVLLVKLELENGRTQTTKIIF